MNIFYRFKAMKRVRHKASELQLYDNAISSNAESRDWRRCHRRDDNYGIS